MDKGHESFDQVELMESSGADSYYLRNRSSLAKHDWSNDSVLRALADCAIEPTSALEIGCADGARLNELAGRGVKAVGLEPSSLAVEAGRRAHPDVSFIQSSHRGLKDVQTGFDLVIMGFFAYLIPPNGIFEVAANIDRLLTDGGWVAILDFIPARPTVRPNVHDPGVWTYKVDHARVFASHPQYLEIYRRLYAHSSVPEDIDLEQERMGVTVLKKLAVANAFASVPI